MRKSTPVVRIDAQSIKVHAQADTAIMHITHRNVHLWFVHSDQRVNVPSFQIGLRVFRLMSVFLVMSPNFTLKLCEPIKACVDLLRHRHLSTQCCDPWLASHERPQLESVLSCKRNKSIHMYLQYARHVVRCTAELVEWTDLGSFTTATQIYFAKALLIHTKVQMEILTFIVNGWQP
jgi:hypothetical protein